MTTGGAERRASVVDRGWFLDWIGDTQVVYMDGRVTDESYARYLATVGANLRGLTGEERQSFLYHVPEPSTITHERRVKLGALLDAHADVIARVTVAFVMATPSTMVRLSLRMLFWMAPPRYPNRVVATPDEGFAFIATHHPAMPADAPRLYQARLAELLPRLEGT